jgi:hypothetical protein
MAFTALGFLLLTLASRWASCSILGGRFCPAAVTPPSWGNVLRAREWAGGRNITVAQAYIADITDENRTIGMGMLGAAFGWALSWDGNGRCAGSGAAVPAFAAAGRPL